MEKVFDEEKVKIRFEGQTHQIDVKTLTSSLLVFSEALKEINAELKTGKSIEVKIEALNPGSFEVQAILSAITHNDLLLAMAVADGVTGIIAKTYSGIVGLRYWLKQDENEQIESTDRGEEKTTIKTKSGNTYICSNVVYNTYYNSQAINDAISDQFRILEEDPAIDGFTMTSGNESFSVPKADFTILAQKVDIPGENKRKETKNSQIVSVVKPLLENNATRRWEFIWEGNKISANITDLSFLEKIGEGEHRFGAGDKMLVDLQINQTLNPLYDVWLNESYQISLVHELIPREAPIKKIGLF